jgi:NTP pyrophosphatase (non-canonical NTP hydrolase)
MKNLKQIRSAALAEEHIAEASKKKSSDTARVNAGAMSKSEFDSKWKKPAKKSLAGPGGLYKNLVKEEDIDEAATFKEGTEEDMAEGNKENKGKKNAYVSSIIQKKLHPTILPSLKYGRSNLKKNQDVSEDAAEDMAKHHDAAQAAKKAGDNDAFHKHMAAKFEVAKKRDAENAKKPVVKIGEELKDACWKGYEAIGMKNKNGKQVPNCVPKESVDNAGGTDLNEAGGYKQHSRTAAMHSQAAKDNPSISTHIKAANSHLKASNSHSRKLDKLIRNNAPAADLTPHETMVKQHDKQVVMHKFMAHRLIKKHMNEAVEIAEAIDLEKNAKITKHSQAAVAAERRGDKHAQQFHLAIVAKLKNESVEVTEGTEETDGSEEVSMAKSQLLKVVDMAKDLANAMDDEDELEAWIQNKITTAYNQLDDVHSYVEYGEDLQDEKHDTADKDTPMDESVIGKETEEDGEETAGMSDKEKKSLARLQALIRLGLLDRQRLPIIARAIKKLDTERPINNIAEKLALFELLHSMIAIVTGDTSVFAKVRSSVIRK